MPRPHSALSAEDQARLDAFEARMRDEAAHLAGYPTNARFDYTPLLRLLDLPLNNVGDPFTPAHIRVNSHEFEREVVQTVGGLVGAVPGDTWGYVTSGGTEGNMYGIYLGRELMTNGVVYYSEATHYSVPKIMRLVHARNITIRARPDGSMDLDDLRETLRIHRDVPPIIFANVGTTMTGAIDDLAGIRRILDDLAIQRRYIHVDAALSGMILPFVEGAAPFGFDAGIDSLSVSGHKFIGSPVPCGVVLARRSHVERIARAVEYVGTLDTTISGSRSALGPLVLWYALRAHGQAGLREQVAECLATAAHAVARLRSAGIDAWRHKHSITVVFPRPSLAVLERWQLAAHGLIAHLITMPHVDRKLADAVIDDLIADLGSDSSKPLPRPAP